MIEGAGMRYGRIAAALVAAWGGILFALRAIPFGGGSRIALLGGVLLLIIAPTALVYAVLGVKRDKRKWLPVLAGVPALVETALVVYFVVPNLEKVLMALCYLFFLI